LSAQGKGVTLLRMSSRVIVVQCRDYAGVAGAVARLLDDLGGMAVFVKPGQSVLIKPNLLTDAKPDEAVTTHPEVIRALIRAVRGAGGVPWVADSPANVVDLARVWDKTGIGALCREEEVSLVNLEQAGSETFEESGMRFTIAKPVLEADVVITVPKVKTHVLTGLTGAVKNLYGVVPGFQKTALHKRYPRATEFGEMLAAVYGRVKPALAVADGVVAMDGDGPSAGAPFPMGIMAGSSDAVALDTVLCRMMGMDPAQIVHLMAAARRGLGVCDFNRIVVEGDGVRATPVRGCRLPRTLPTALIPKWLVKAIEPFIWHRPVFRECCIACGQCVKACPVGALSLKPRQRPMLDKRVCIACCCCHEICPVHAVEMTSSPLFRMVLAMRAKRGGGAA
jgi:uncharacterized protein (DUF362 family)/Pyruvate/2-oxoacid:ferredoxin oxidoreductase delta subunit